MDPDSWNDWGILWGAMWGAASQAEQRLGDDFMSQPLGFADLSQPGRTASLLRLTNCSLSCPRSCPPQPPPPSHSSPHTAPRSYGLSTPSSPRPPRISPTCKKSVLGGEPSGVELWAKEQQRKLLGWLLLAIFPRGQKVSSAVGRLPPLPMGGLTRASHPNRPLPQLYPTDQESRISSARNSSSNSSRRITSSWNTCSHN